MRRPFPLSKEELYKLYWIDGLSTVEIAKRIGVPSATVYAYMKEYGIPIRKKTRITKEELYKLYWIEGLSTREIAKRVGMQQSTILRLMKKYDIPVERGVRLAKEELYKLYWVDGLSIRKIAERFNMSPSGIHYYMRKYGIPVRKRHTDIYEEHIDEWAYVIGAFIGDGNIYYNPSKKGYRISFWCGFDKDFADTLTSCLKKITNAEVKTYFLKKGGYVISVKSKKLCEALKDEGFKERYINSRPELFIRGLFDADGSIYFIKYDNVYRIEIANKKYELLSMVRELLRRMGIESSIYKKRSGVYYLVIRKASSVFEFARKIGSSIERKRKKMLEVIEKYKGWG